VANQNFVVHNGLTVGSTTITAATGDVTIAGNLIVQGATTIVGNTTMSNETANVINVTVSETIKGVLAATTADATALAIALGG
jgi:hypothetical protein